MMQYKFSIYIWGNTKVYNVETQEGDYKVLENFTWHGWTTTEAQRVIDGVKATQSGVEQKFRFQVGEDIAGTSLDDGVYLFDLLASRATGIKTMHPALILTHAEFLNFMQKLKAFLESQGV